MPLVVVVELVDAEYLGAFDVVYGIVPDHEGLPLGLAPCLQVVLPADAGEPFYRVSEAILPPAERMASSISLAPGISLFSQTICSR